MHRMMPLVPFLPLVLAACGSSPPMTSQQAFAAGDLRKSGTVDFPVTCKPEVKADFDAAVALLHSFFYEEARRRFLAIAERDPDCAMAWWGVAMTWYHPLWAPPTPQEMEQGAAAAAKARQLGGKTERERGFIAAISDFYGSEEAPASGPVAQSCHGPRVFSARAQCFRQGMERLREKFPDDLEVTVFTTLAMLGTAPPTDKMYHNQVAAAAILEPLFAQHPDHPGIAHYIIHAYDYPTLAPRALDAARRYADIAPWVPHALHMPSHIYTRLGMWEDSIASNLASADAARDYARRVLGGVATMDELHALDYLVFAYLQTARDGKAKAIVEHMLALAKFPPEHNFASAYAIGAIPARWTLERRQWQDAAALAMPHPAVLKPFPFAESHIEFARAVGAARSGQKEIAAQAIARMQELRAGLADPKFQWWISQVEIQRLAAAGWLAHAQGDDAEAERLLRESARLEDESGTHPVTPGQILPAREQLGDLLLELGRPADALVEFEQSLAAFPNRFQGHFGAGRAAELAGDKDKARQHYQHLAGMTRDGDRASAELATARAFLAKG